MSTVDARAISPVVAQASSFGDQPLEPVRVEVVRSDGKGISGLRGDDRHQHQGCDAVGRSVPGARWPGWPPALRPTAASISLSALTRLSHAGAPAWPAGLSALRRGRAPACPRQDLELPQHFPLFPPCPPYDRRRAGADACLLVAEVTTSVRRQSHLRRRAQPFEERAARPTKRSRDVASRDVQRRRRHRFSSDRRSHRHEDKADLHPQSDRCPGGHRGDVVRPDVPPVRTRRRRGLGARRGATPVT